MPTSSQSGYNDSSTIQQQVDQAPPVLPFTGMDAGVLLAGGVGLIALGALIKRKLHPVPPYA